MNTENIKAKQLPGTAKYLNGISFFLADEDKCIYRYRYCEEKFDMRRLEQVKIH